MNWRLTNTERMAVVDALAADATWGDELRAHEMAQARKLLEWLNDQAVDDYRLNPFMVVFDHSFWDALLKEVS